MMTMTTSTAHPTLPRHPSQATNIPTPPSPREVSTASNSNVWQNHNNSYDPPNFLQGNPTKISLSPSNAAVVNLPVDDDTQNPQPNNTVPDRATLQEWNDFRADFDDFFSGFAKFRDKYGPLTKIQANEASTICTCSVNDDSDKGAVTAGRPEFLRVIGELKKANSQFSQLLDRLENAPRLQPPSKITSNPQPPVQPQIPCEYGKVPPASTPDPHTVALGAATWDPNSSPTTIHNAPTMTEDNGLTFAPLPPPAPDPVDMVTTEVLWPQPGPARKTFPFKKKPQTKHTIVRCRDQDLRPP